MSDTQPVQSTDAIINIADRLKASKSQSNVYKMASDVSAAVDAINRVGENQRTQVRTAELDAELATISSNLGMFFSRYGMALCQAWLTSFPIIQTIRDVAAASAISALRAAEAKRAAAVENPEPESP